MVFYFLFPNPTTTHVDFELLAAQVSLVYVPFFFKIVY